MVVAAVVVAAAVASRVQLNEYVITPGDAQPVGPLITVPATRAHRLTGSVLLTDVYLTRLSVLGWIRAQFDGNASIVPAQAVLGPATPASQLVTQGYLQMAQAQQAAKAAALTRLGFHVAQRRSGVLIYAVTHGSPATGHLRVGQTVEAVDGTSTPDGCAFAQALADHRPSQTVVLTVERSTVTSAGAIKPGPTGTERLRLASWPGTIPKPASTASCPGAAAPGRGYLGVEAVTDLTYRYPFRVGIRTATIGGPSAGLSMTLGIIDALSGGRLTGGLTVAATGTIAPTGSVGPVGGVPQKAVAVERAGATVFIVPAGQVRTAKSKAGPSLRVFGVRTLTQALADLGTLGGTVPPAPAS